MKEATQEAVRTATHEKQVRTMVVRRQIRTEMPLEMPVLVRTTLRTASLRTLFDRSERASTTEIARTVTFI
jgi:hypothetical protein